MERLASSCLTFLPETNLGHGVLHPKL
jgi:hypothetical protein